MEHHEPSHNHHTHNGPGNHEPSMTHHEPEIDAQGYGTMLRIDASKAVGPHRLEAMLGEVVMAIALECMQKGAKAIGHIKSNLSTSAGYVKADVVRVKDGAYTESNLEKPGDGGDLVINSIVLGLEKEKIAEITLRLTKSILKSYGFSSVEETSCQVDLKRSSP